jgi:hypothetical protein
VRFRRHKKNKPLLRNHGANLLLGDKDEEER